MKDKFIPGIILASVILLISACAPVSTPSTSTPTIAPTSTVAATTAAVPTTVPPTATATSVPTIVPLALTATPIVPTFTPSTTAKPLAGMSSEAYLYLSAALDILQQHSLERNYINWATLRADAQARAAHAQTTAQTYGAIVYALTQLGDHHSMFYTPDRYTHLEELKVSDNQPVQAKLLQNQLAYLLIPGFVTADENQRHLYVNQLQTLIRNLDAGNPCGWVLDLRQNIGGNIWPMFAGLGPLLGDGNIGAFVYPDGEKQTWSYSSGQALLNAWVMATVDGGGYQLRHGAPPVAVLTGPGTISAGEAVTIAFRGRPNTRSFGQATAGLSTANSTYELSDGAAIVLTVVVDADRIGHAYGSVVKPDQIVATARDGSDAPLQAATTWLKQQTACNDAIH